MKIVHEEELFRGKLRGVRETVAREDGKTFRFEMIYHPGAVVIVPVRQDGQLLMLRQYRHALRTSIFEFPAGTLEIGEEPLGCAQREIREETGFAAGHIESLGIIHPAPGFCNEVQHLFLARNLSLDPAPQDEDEIIEVIPMSIKEVEERILNGDITDAKTIAALFRARLRGLL